MIADNRRARAHLDVPLIVLVLAMSAFGVLAVCVATYGTASEADSWLTHILESSYALKQLFFTALAPVIVGLIVIIPFHWLKHATQLAYYGGTFLILFTWVTNGAEGVKAWMDVFWGMTIQPSEFIKLAMILMLARELAKSEQPMSTGKEFWRIALLILVPGAIILGSGETGSLIVIVFFSAVMIFFSNVNIKLILLVLAAGILAILALYGTVVALGIEDYRINRILAFLNPELSPLGDAYQQTQSKITIGSGGFDGIGTFVDGAMSQLNYVPADWTDFIYATIGEAWGFVGCFAVLGMYLAIILRMLYLARYTYDRYGMLIIIGVMAMLLFHVFENIGMTLGLMPITGIPLPFLSYGGSNMTTTMGGIGLVLNVTRNRSLTAQYSTPQRSSGTVRYIQRR